MKLFKNFVLNIIVFSYLNFGLMASYEMIEDDIPETQLKCYSVTSSKGWIAKSARPNDQDVLMIKEILDKKSPVERIYANFSSEQLETHLKNIQSRAPYISMLVKDLQNNPLAFIILGTFPRAVTYPDTQTDILETFRQVGVMEKNGDQYRPIEDGQSSLLQMRLIPVENEPADVDLYEDIVQGVSQFIAKKASNCPVPFYSTDKSQGLPKYVTNFAHLHPVIQQAYKNAGFQDIRKQGHKQWYAPDFFEKLEDEPAFFYKDLKKISDDGSL